MLVYFSQGLLKKEFIVSPGVFRMSNTLPSFKTFAGLVRPSYSSSFLLLVLFTVAVSLKNQMNKHLSQRNPLKINSHLVETRISNFHASY